jgi:hypothetical protein
MNSAQMPRIAVLYVPDEDDYGIVLYDPRRGAWVLLANCRSAGDVGPDRIKDLIHLVPAPENL